MANATIGWTSNEIPAQSHVTLEIEWSPKAVWSTREVIQFTDNRNFKKDVPVILKSVDKSQNPRAALRKTVHGAENKMVTKKLTLKSPSRPKLQRNRLTVFNASAIANAHNLRKERPAKSDVNQARIPTASMYPAVPSNVTFDENMSEALLAAQDKENMSPPSPKDICSVIGSIAFTPVSKSRNDTNLDYLASLPTPGSNAKAKPTDYPRHHMHMTAVQFSDRLDDIDLVPSTPHTIQNRTTTIENFQTPIDRIDGNVSDFALQKTPALYGEHTFDVSGMGTPCVEPKYSASDSNPIKNNCQNALDVAGQHHIHHPHNHIHHSPRMQTIAENTELSYTVNRTQTISSPTTALQLSVIAEERTKAELSETYVKYQSTQHLTFNLEESSAAATAVDENLVRDVRLVGTPLKKKFQSLKELTDSHNNLSIEQMILKNNQGSMPNLHKMDTVKSIENNRYFYQSVEKDLQEPTRAELEVDDDMENLGDTSICSIQSAVSTQSIAFREHEILAQSSVFNLNEIGCGESLHANADISMFSGRLRHGPSNNKSDLNSSKHLSMSSPTIGRTMGPPRTSHSVRDLVQSNRKQAVSAYNLNASTTSLHKRSYGDRSMDKHSPTKRACMDATSPRLPRGQSIRTKDWNGKMAKKVRLPSVPIQKLQLKRHEEERVILYDPEHHLRGNVF